MDGWTTIPRWLYENDLPDDQLQDWYAKAARMKVQALRRERDRHPDRSPEWYEADALVLKAEVFLVEAEAALAHYRTHGRRLKRG